MRHFRSVTLLFIGAAGVMFAQSSATLTGVVVDASGAVVNDSVVTAENTETKVKYPTKTNAEGLFRLPNLPIGPYEVTVTQPGFEQLVRSGIQIYTGQTLNLRLELKLGQASQTVEVTGSAPIVQTADSQLQTTFTARNTRELPLNGRNPLQLVALTPGANLSNVGTAGNQQENPGVTVNGLRSLDNNYELDGSLYLNRMHNAAPVLPNPDALEEFTVKAANNDATSSGAGATVQLSTRSGTNNFHGTLVEFLRNDAVDARSYFSSGVTSYKRNQYGATFGGPIVKEKTFFFGSYQGTRVSGGASPTIVTVPTAEQRAGNFAASPKTLIDPDTGAQFPGNVIPASRINPLSQKLLEYVGLPNFGTSQLTQTPNTDSLDEQFSVRIDHTLTSKDHLTGRYSFDEYDYNRLTSAFANIYARNFFRTQNVVLTNTHTFSPALVFVAGFGFTRNARTQIPTEPVTLDTIGQKAVKAVADAAPELRVNVNGYFNLFSGGGLGHDANIWHYRGRFSYVRGRHALQFGLDVERDQMYTYDTSFASGTSTFNGSRTAHASVTASGDAFADFLLGLPNNFNQAARSPQDFKEVKWQPFIQDDWRIHPRFTLNLGLRWEPWLPPVNSRAPGAAFVPGVQSVAAPNAPVGLLFYGDPGIQKSIFPRDWNNLAPRIGFAWDVKGDGSNVVRSAYGIFYRSIPLNLVRVSYSGSAFTSLTVDITNPYSFDDPYHGYAPGNPFPFTVPPASELGTYQFVSPVVTSVLDPASKTGYTQQWNFTYERQLRNDLALSVGYVGNRSIGIMATWQANAAVYGPGATTGNVQSRRRYQGLGALAIASPWGKENYNGLQAQITKRAGRGLSLLANYVYSKCMDNTTGQVLGADAGGGSQFHKFDLNADYARCDFDATHTGNASAVYDLPRTSLRGAAGVLANGWTITGILSLRSGLPFSVRSGRDNSLTGVPNNDLADQLAVNITRPAGADKTVYFDKTLYAVNAIGTFGNTGRNSMTGPGSWNLDSALVKHTQFTERLALQLRFEGFNVFNHTRFNNPVATVTNANFGNITSSQDPRVLQIGAKLLF